ncbi:hypothetical protein SCRES3_gp105 [Synechococcus phage S-CRES3]|nr:hypothetical protein SCRES3_gp105 [Synechococcus phage S-CRES3]
MKKNCAYKNQCNSLKVQVRIALALLATTSFIMGMAAFMMFLCSSSPKHREHLAILFTQGPAALHHTLTSHEKHLHK